MHHWQGEGLKRIQTGRQWCLPLMAAGRFCRMLRGKPMARGQQGGGTRSAALPSLSPPGLQSPPKAGLPPAYV